MPQIAMYRLPGVLEVTGLSKATIYRLLERGEFRRGYSCRRAAIARFHAAARERYAGHVEPEAGSPHAAGPSGRDGSRGAAPDPARRGTYAGCVRTGR